MEIHFKTTFTTTDEHGFLPNPTVYAERKIRPLKKLVAHFNETTHVYVEMGKANAAHTGAIWRVLINLDSHGQRYHTEAVSETLQGAIDKTVKEMEVELRKVKQRSTSMVHRGGTALKSLMRGFSL